MNRLHLGILIALFGVLQGCASTLQATPEHEADFFNSKAHLGITSEAVIPHLHGQRKVNWSSYDKVQLGLVAVSEDFSAQLGPEKEQDLSQLANAFHGLLAQRLSQDYVLVDEPAHGAMLIQATVRHAEQSWLAPQVLSKLSWQLQALNSVVIYARGKPAFAGEMTIEFTVQDSLTGELLFAGTDRRVGGQNLFDKEVFNSGVMPRTA